MSTQRPSATPTPSICLPESYFSGQAIRFVPPLTAEEIAALWDEVCPPDPVTKRPSGLAREVVRRCVRLRPNEEDPYEYMNNVLADLSVRFRRYYNSNFKPPLPRWLWIQAKSAALDYNRKAVRAIKRHKACVSYEEWEYAIRAKYDPPDDDNDGNT